MAQDLVLVVVAAVVAFAIERPGAAARTLFWAVFRSMPPSSGLGASPEGHATEVVNGIQSFAATSDEPAITAVCEFASAMGRELLNWLHAWRVAMMWSADDGIAGGVALLGPGLAVVTLGFLHHDQWAAAITETVYIVVILAFVIGIRRNKALYVLLAAGGFAIDEVVIFATPSGRIDDYFDLAANGLWVLGALLIAIGLVRSSVICVRSGAGLLAVGVLLNTVACVLPAIGISSDPLGVTYLADIPAMVLLAVAFARLARGRTRLVALQ